KTVLERSRSRTIRCSLRTGDNIVARGHIIERKGVTRSKLVEFWINVTQAAERRDIAQVLIDQRHGCAQCRGACGGSPDHRQALIACPETARAGRQWRSILGAKQISIMIGRSSCRNIRNMALGVTRNTDANLPAWFREVNAGSA